MFDELAVDAAEVEVARERLRKRALERRVELRQAGEHRVELVDLRPLHRAEVVNRSRTIGPPTLPPNWLRRYAGFSASNTPRALSDLSRKYSNAVPCTVLVPDLVTTCTMPPVASPNSALYCTLLTLNSSTASSGRFWRGSPSSAKLLMTPSTRLPVELNVTEPPTLTVAKNARVESMLVPGISSASDRYCRELIGSVSICCCVTTPDTSDFVVSTTGAVPVTVIVSATVCTCIVKSWISPRPIVISISRTSMVRKARRARPSTVKRPGFRAGNRYAAVRVGDGRARHAGLLVAQRDGDSRQHASLGIADGAADHSRAALGRGVDRCRHLRPHATTHAQPPIAFSDLARHPDLLILTATTYARRRPIHVTTCTGATQPDGSGISDSGAVRRESRSRDRTRWNRRRPRLIPEFLFPVPRSESLPPAITRIVAPNERRAPAVPGDKWARVMRWPPPRPQRGRRRRPGGCRPVAAKVTPFQYVTSACADADQPRQSPTSTTNLRPCILDVQIRTKSLAGD